MKVFVFAPTTGLMTLLYAMQERGALHLPYYSLTIFDGDRPRRIYVGELDSADSESRGATDFLEVIANFYGGEVFALLMTTSWGAYEHRDLEILDDLGLIYSSFRCDIDGQNRRFSRMRNGRWRPAEEIRAFAAFDEYFHRNRRLFITIDAKLSPRINEGIWDGTPATAKLEPLIDEEVLSRGKYYDSAPTECDVCTIPLSGESYISDGSLRGRGIWATMCADCTVHHGAGIAWGTGQLYRKEGDGRWLMVAGGDPTREEYDES